MIPPARRRPDSDEAGRHWARLLWRGVRKRCPRCGGGDIFRTWFQMRERCPACGLKFERESGFFVGAYTINLAISIVSLFALCMTFLAFKAANPDAGYGWFLVVGLVIAVTAPLGCYPFARTIWSAIDLGMTPLGPTEEAEAATAAASNEPSGRGPGRRRS